MSTLHGALWSAMLRHSWLLTCRNVHYYLALSKRLRDGLECSPCMQGQTFAKYVRRGNLQQRQTMVRWVPSSGFNYNPQRSRRSKRASLPSPLDPGLSPEAGLRPMTQVSVQWVLGRCLQWAVVPCRCLSAFVPNSGSILGMASRGFPQARLADMTSSTNIQTAPDNRD